MELIVYSGDNYKYQGSYHNGKREGEGILRRDNGDVTSGIWSNGRLLHKYN